MEETPAKPHSLSEAVLDGTVTAAAAFCGLDRGAITALMPVHGSAKIRVRLRSAEADGQAILSVAELYEWQRLQLPLYRHDRWWSFCDIRDVMPILNRTGLTNA